MSSYLINYQDRANDALRKPYPNNILGVYKYYIEYVFQVPKMDFVNEVFQTKQNAIYKQILQQGVARDIETEKSILENVQAHKNDPRFSTSFILGYENNSEALLSDIKKLISFCKNNAIEIKTIVNPVYKSCFLENNVDLYFDFLKK